MQGQQGAKSRPLAGAVQDAIREVLGRELLLFGKHLEQQFHEELGELFANGAQPDPSRHGNHVQPIATVVHNSDSEIINPNQALQPSMSGSARSMSSSVSPQWSPREVMLQPPGTEMKFTSSEGNFASHMRRRSVLLQRVLDNQPPPGQLRIPPRIVSHASRGQSRDISWNDELQGAETAIVAQSRCICRGFFTGWDEHEQLIPAPHEQHGCERQCPRLVAWIHSAEFNYASAVTILLYAVFLGYETDQRAQHFSVKRPSHISQACNLAFNFVFLIELCLRFIAEGWYFFCMEGWAWNCFDILIVLLPMIEDILLFEEAEHNQHNVGLMRVLRVLRITRTLRLFRVVRFFKEMRMVMSSIVVGLRVLFWTVLLLLIWMYFMGICITQIVTDFKHTKTSYALDSADLQQLQTDFSSLSGTMMVLYQVISGGLDWSKALLLLSPCGLVASALVVCYVTVTYFGLMNVIVSLFVTSVFQNDLAHRQESHMENFVQVFGKSHSESISLEEFKEQMKDERMIHFFEDIDMPVRDAHVVFNLLDVDLDGEVDMSEFITGCVRLFGEAKAIDLAIFHRDFQKACLELTRTMKRIESEVLSSSGAKTYR